MRDPPLLMAWWSKAVACGWAGVFSRTFDGLLGGPWRSPLGVRVFPDIQSCECCYHASVSVLTSQSFLSNVLLLIVTLAVLGCGDPQSSAEDAGERGDGGGCEVTGCGDPAAPHCDPTTHRCVACVEASHCSDPVAPLCSSGSCRPCATDTQCMDRLGRSQCRADGRCVECATASDCSALEPYCTADGLCAECEDESDCSGLAPACDAGQCRSCSDTTCTDEERLRELLALHCATAIEHEGISDIFEAFEALYCSDRPELFVIYDYLKGAVRAGRIALDEARFPECGRQAPLGLTDSEACRLAMRGTVDDGGICALPLECLSGRCEVPSASCAGTCVPRDGAGVTCSDDDACEAGLICLDTICQMPPPEGGTCTGRCAEGLFCDARRVCEPRRDVGGACRGIGIGGDCLDELACRSNRCAAPPIAGETCWPEYLPRCAEGLRCVRTTCRAPSPAGTSCASTIECESGARCHEGVCRMIVVPGEACEPGDPCALGTGCHDGRCRPLPDLGEPCFTAGCLRGVCQAGTCQARALFSACDAGTYLFDVLDPCGGTSSCVETPSGWQCVPEGGPDAACGGEGDLPCRAPDLACDSSRTCVAYCSI